MAMTLMYQIYVIISMVSGPVIVLILFDMLIYPEIKQIIQEWHLNQFRYFFQLIDEECENESNISECNRSCICRES